MSLAATVPKRAVTVVCPGLTQADHCDIPQYLRQTHCVQGGAPLRHVLKKTISGQLRLSGQRSLTKLELHQRSLVVERAQAKWLNEHNMGAIFSTSCMTKGIIGANGIVIACEQCRFLLTLRIFRTALRRKGAKPENAKYTPKAYRNEVVGNAYLRHKDVKELVEAVCLLALILSCTANIHPRMVGSHAGSSSRVVV
jgi:hypothetical protein